MDKNQKKELDILMLKFYETLQKKDFGFDDLGRPHSIHGDKDSYDRITDFLLQNGPQKLYRYRPGHDWDIESLRNDTISLSTLKEFNDPFELRKTIDFESVGNDYCQNYPEETGKVLDMNHNSKTRPDYYLKQVEKFKECGNNLQEDLSMKKLRVFVACFSEIKSSLLMWAHYADSHRGICIGYNFIDLVDRFGPNIIPITYSKEYFAICSYEEYIHYKKFFLNEISHKSEEWSYEKEWRLFGSYRKNDPYIPRYSVDMVKPSCIYMGVNITDNLRKQLKQICREKGIELYQMAISDKGYRLIAYQQKLDR